MQAIATGNTQAAANNVHFFVAAHLLADDDKAIQTAVDQYLPSLPSPSISVRRTIVDRVRGLTSVQALLLAKAMEPYISQRAESLKRALRTLDPDGLHLKSADAAARFLQMWVALDSGDAKEEKEWEDALDSLPVNIDEQFPKSHFTYADMERYITLHRNIGGTTEIIDAGDVWLLRTTYPSQK